MSKKIMYLAWFAVLVCIVSSAPAIDRYYWTTGSPNIDANALFHKPGGVDWQDPNSWRCDSFSPPTPAGPPDDNEVNDFEYDYHGDYAGINTCVCNIPLGVVATPYRIVIGANKYHNDPCHPYYDVNAINPEPEGVLNVYSFGRPSDPCEFFHYGLRPRMELLIGHQQNGEGVLNVYGTAYGEQLRCSEATGTDAIVNVYDGGHLQVGWWGCFLGWNGSHNQMGTVRINLKGTGSMTVWGDPCSVVWGWTGGDLSGAGIQMSSHSHIDIEAGTLAVWDSNVPWSAVQEANLVPQLQGYVDSNWITVYGGRIPDCNPYVWHNHDVNYTYVEANGPGCPCHGYIVGDFDKDCYVNFKDMTVFASHWLECTKPDDAECWP